ncbi:interleukin-1 receptor-associated kinase 1 [Erpetoichthys calabaricus]|uniref:non-specific serine/threonine protein kinase n=1 Tax=Erpetoichthys calabaricus TaxID=27687 RepID=A0A8C4S5N2_ERPCA|nr:interleukin-1 receptor-associated kinase 1 [Erpetoichthys calabaricus]
MSVQQIENEFIYNLPSKIFCEFCTVMDALCMSDWQKFAASIVQDYTDLRLFEKKEHRTSEVMTHWQMRNARVGDLLQVLNELKLLRARDIILSWQPTVLSPTPPSQRSMTPPPPYPSITEVKVDDQKKSSKSQEPAVLPKPGPPPKNLHSEEVQPESQISDSFKIILNLSQNVLFWPLGEIMRSTENFSGKYKIGEGGFGDVYKANMRDTDYAVKKLKEESDLDWNTVKESFKTEMEKLNKYRHPNVVELAGYSIENNIYCLIYLYMPGGSLEKCLHEKGTTVTFLWRERINILLGTAKAVQFLHSEEPKLIHGDIKSANILLDEHLNPKLADFGLARFIQSNRTPGRTSTVARTQSVRGTMAYLPPEYIRNGEISTGTDVYSFGVVVLEVLTGRKALEANGKSNHKYLKDLVKEEEESAEIPEMSLKSRPAFERSRKVAENICKKYLDKMAGACDSVIPLELCSLACQCLKLRKSRPPISEVYKTLKTISSQFERPLSAVNSLMQAQSSESSIPPSSFSLKSNTEQFSRRSVEPQENTFFAPSMASDVLTLTSRNSAFSEQQHDRGNRLQDVGSSQTPCESDESQGYSQYCSPQSLQQSSCWSSVHKTNGSVKANLSSLEERPVLQLQQVSSLQTLNCPAASVHQIPNHQVVENPMQNYALPGSSVNTWQGRGSTQVEPGSKEAGSFSPYGIIINPAKEKICERLALYNQGKIDSYELLSSGPEIINQDHASRTPEESDDF